ncbi:MAG: ATP synthase F0 subunit B [Terracidiphilus sp.]
MTSIEPQISVTLRPFRWALAAAVVLVLAIVAPYRTIAQSSASQPNAAASASAGSASAEQPKSDEDQEKAFLYSPVVQSIARMLHLSVKTTSAIFLGINFAVIFLAIVIPLGRMMPKVLHKRSQTLGQDLQTARQATADATARLSAVEQKLAGLDEEIKKFRAQVESDSLEDEKRIKAAIVEESSRIVAAAEQEIAAAATQARRGLRNFAAGLAIDHAEKQLAITPDTDRALIAEFVAGVGGDGRSVGGKS